MKSSFQRSDPRLAQGANGPEEERVQACCSFLKQSGAREIHHSGSNLFRHLCNTHRILRGWQCRPAISIAGLCSSLYGWVIPSTRANRRKLRKLIGAEAERLAYLFSLASTEALEACLVSGSNAALAIGPVQMTLTLPEWQGLLAIEVAKTLESLARVPIKPQQLERDRQFARQALPWLPEGAVEDLCAIYRLPGQAGAEENPSCSVADFCSDGRASQDREAVQLASLDWPRGETSRGSRLNLVTDDLVALEQRRFPTQESAMQALLALFRDKVPVLESQTSHEWFYRMVAIRRVHAYPDASVPQQLVEFLQIGMDDVANYRVIESFGNRRMLSALNHGWALLAWSEWLANRTPGSPRPLLIHVDSHDDLERPSLMCSADPCVYAAPLGPERLDLRLPSSIAPFLLRGFLGIGSFMVPFLHALEECDIVHIFPSAKYPSGMRLAQLRPFCERFLHFGGVCWRPGVQVVDAEPTEMTTGLRYFLTDDLSILQRLQPCGPVLLDVDMDYFCNRFDDASTSDSDPHPSLNQVQERINELEAHLRQGCLAPSVEVVTLALSPGFYPASYWPGTLPQIQTMLRSILEASSKR